MAHAVSDEGGQDRFDAPKVLQLLTYVRELAFSKLARLVTVRAVVKR